MEFVHKSVLFDESIDSLNIDSTKTIVDGTAGGGGHSKAIAQKAGRLIAIDQDPDAIKVLHERLDDLGNVTIVQNNFSNVDQVLKELNVASIDGMLLDLGVSSFQLDTADRGFSYHKDAPLDMRMSKSGMSAKDVV
ncbi:MAG: 16S rRNA (cytosine(1402)-N(4))-methyltransferase, partial [Eubacterium coprostanoligenes]|nr:16S rRNA (cytosine(1402)-N(4))-methyltransferase [Eubacterium coprostanoligenes]